MKKICLALILLFMNFFAYTIDARCQERAVGDNPPSTVITNQPARSALVRVIENYVSKNSENIGKIKVTKLDVQGAWAMAEFMPQEQQLDSGMVLLHKQRGRWKALVMGTALYGTGRTYGVPMVLRKKWGL